MISNDEQFEWRETYFVLFDQAKRPSLKQVEQAVLAAGSHFQLNGAAADDEGKFESLNVVSPHDHAALEIDYLDGSEVLEQVANLGKDVRASTGIDPQKLARLSGCNARFEIMHFEEMIEPVPGDEGDDVFDPSALLMVLEALVKLTDGVGVDPQSGTLV